MPLAGPWNCCPAMMLDRTVFRLAALAALFGVVLRLVAALPLFPTGQVATEWLYMTIDYLLLLGLSGVLAREPRLRNPIGISGFVIATAGIFLIRTGLRVGPAGAYQNAAAVFSIGLALIGVATLRTEPLLRSAGFAWLASLLVGATAANLPGGFLVASLLFCLGFALAGIWLFLKPSAP